MEKDDYKSVTLYDIHADNGDWFTMTASFNGRVLMLFNHDFSKLHEELFGDDECEVFRVFDAENVNKLLALFHTTDLLSSLSEFFEGKMRDEEFYDICKENNIDFEYHVR